MSANAVFSLGRGQQVSRMGIFGVIRFMIVLLTESLNSGSSYD